MGAGGIAEPKTLRPIICVKPNPTKYPAAPPIIPITITSVKTETVTAVLLAPIAFFKPISALLSITLAVTKFEIPRAEAIKLKTVIKSINKLVLFKIAPSDSATCLIGFATASVITS